MPCGKRRKRLEKARQVRKRCVEGGRRRVPCAIQEGKLFRMKLGGVVLVGGHLVELERDRSALLDLVLVQGSELLVVSCGEEKRRAASASLASARGRAKNKKKYLREFRCSTRQRRRARGAPGARPR